MSVNTFKGYSRINTNHNYIKKCGFDMMEILKIITYH